jgi:uncharacterized protein with PIN domain
VIFIEQNLGPHIEQKWAIFAPTAADEPRCHERRQHHCAAQRHRDLGRLRERRAGEVAGLRDGHCQSSAVARLAGEPLLFVGEDFAQTDLVAA